MNKKDKKYIKEQIEKLNNEIKECKEKQDYYYYKECFLMGKLEHYLDLFYDEKTIKI